MSINKEEKETTDEKEKLIGKIRFGIGLGDYTVKYNFNRDSNTELVIQSGDDNFLSIRDDSKASDTDYFVKDIDDSAVWVIKKSVNNDNTMILYNVKSKKCLNIIKNEETYSLQLFDNKDNNYNLMYELSLPNIIRIKSVQYNNKYISATKETNKNVHVGYNDADAILHLLKKKDEKEEKEEEKDKNSKPLIRMAVMTAMSTEDSNEWFNN
eukprot:432768_1